MKIDEMRIKEIGWIKTVTRPMFLYGQISQTEAERDLLQKKVGFGFKNKVLFPEEGGHTQYFGKEDWGNFVFAIKKKLEQEKDWLKEYPVEVYKLGEKIVEFLEKISKTDFAKKTNGELIKYYQEFEKYRGPLAYLLYPHLVLEKILEEMLKEELRKELREKGQENLFDKYFLIISAKTQANESDEEEESLLRISAKFVEKGRIWDKEIDRMLQKHSEKYGWLPYYGYGLPLGDKEYFKKQLTMIKNPKERLNKKSRTKEDQKNEIEKLKMNVKGSKLEELIGIVQTYLHLREYRTEVLRKSYYYPRNLLSEISRRMKMTLDGILFLTPTEIRDFLEKEVYPSPEKIKERKAHYAIVMIDGEIEVVSDRKEIDTLGQLLMKKEGQKIVLRGTGVYPGKVHGVIKVIRNIKEISKIRKGDILVTTMTTPEMHSAIEKVAGIITDEGGLTCHAAVVSRELHIPCVIATENATKVLKDNDRVILDSEGGVVEVIA